MRVTTVAVQGLGGSGHIEDCSVERSRRETQVRRVVAGADRLQRAVVGRSLVAP